MRAHGPTACTGVCEGLPSAGNSTQQAPAPGRKLMQGAGQHATESAACTALQRHAKAAATDLQCSSIRLSEAPEVASSTGEVSRHRCMHCGARQQQAGCVSSQQGALAGPLQHASTGCWRRQPVPRCVHVAHTPCTKQSPITWAAHGPHLGLVELALLQRASQHGRHLVVGHVRAAAAALLPEQPDLLQARVLGADEVQHGQAFPADVPQQVLAHSSDPAQQRVHMWRDGAPLREACSRAVQRSVLRAGRVGRSAMHRLCSMACAAMR